MSVLGFGKKKETSDCCCGEAAQKAKEPDCACGGGCCEAKPQNARFIVLGACCRKSAETFQNTKQAVLEMGFSDEVLNIGDPLEIAKYGVMQTPALVIDKRVVSYGKLLKVDEIKKLVEKAGLKA